MYVHVYVHCTCTMYILYILYMYTYICIIYDIVCFVHVHCTSIYVYTMKKLIRSCTHTHVPPVWSLQWKPVALWGPAYVGYPHWKLSVASTNLPPVHHTHASAQCHVCIIHVRTCTCACMYASHIYTFCLVNVTKRCRKQSV